MDKRCRELREIGDKLFSKRAPLLSIWQEMARNFYPQMADFTGETTLGEEFASHLMTGFPVYVHRELSNSISSMLRPRGKPWFHARTTDERINEDPTLRAWLDRTTETMTSAMYDKAAQFVGTTKQGDRDWAAFGQTIIEVRPNLDLNGLLYRHKHLRDCVWAENAAGIVDQFHADEKIQARNVVKLFPKTAHQTVKTCAEKDPHKEIKCRRIIVPSEEYDYDKKIKNKDRFRFISLYLDLENDVILEEVPQRRFGIVIPRWERWPCSQYAFSPATIIALPDARMLQNIALTLLEAGQKAVDPPLKATKDVVGAVNTYPGGITWVDEEYDERLGAALEPLIAKDNTGLRFGAERESKTEKLLMDMFYLNKIQLPPPEIDGDMTKYEAQQRVQEYIRGALPLFEPMEVEYNGALCEETFNLCLDLKMFGAMEDMPPVLSNQEIQFQFESPLQEAHERAKTQAFFQVASIVGTAVGIDPGLRHEWDFRKMSRDATVGSAAPADWLFPTEHVDQLRAHEAKQQLAATLAATVGAGAEVAGKVGTGVQELQAAGLM